MPLNSFDPNITPILMPPEGVISNFVDPVSIAYISRNVTYAFLPLMLVFVALRLCSRVMIRYNFGVDDFIYIVAAASIIPVCGILLSLLNHPNGRHGWDVPLSVLTDSYLKINFTFVILSSISIMLVKLSLLALYLRIFSPVQKVKIAIYASIGIITSFYLATMIAELAVGVPRPGGGGWQEAQIKYGPFGLDISVTRGVFGVVSDFVILFIPITQIIKLRLQLKRKIVLVGVFLTGLVACVCSIATCVFRFRELGDEDYTWANIMPNTFAVIELTVGHICCSLPTLPPLITCLSKREILLSIIRYIRSGKTKGSSNNIPIATPSSTPNAQLPIIPKGGLSGLRSFIQRARLANFSQKTVIDETNIQSNYYDLGSVDIDYHTQLKKDIKTQGSTEQV